MKKFLLCWLIYVIALVAVVHIVSGVSVANVQTVIVAALVLGFLNAFVRPILILLTLPLTIVSLGLFTLLINGFLFYLAARFVKGFVVTGFWSAFCAAILFSIISFLLNRMLLPETGGHVRVWQAETGQPAEPRNVIDLEKKGEDKYG